jgi:magnesium chelatase family protein
MAHAMPSILPSMTIEEALEVTKIYSVSGLLPPETVCPDMDSRPSAPSRCRRCQQTSS